MKKTKEVKIGASIIFATSTISAGDIFFATEMKKKLKKRMEKKK